MPLENEAELTQGLEIIRLVESFQTPEEVKEYAASLSPQERRWIAGVDSSKCAFVDKNRPFTGVFNPPSVAISYSTTNTEATPDGAKAIYQQMFGIISSSLVEAKQQQKQLIINIGESHVDPGCGLLNVMALDVAHRLGIQKIGIENPAISVPFTSSDGRPLTRYNLEGWIKHAKEISKNGKLPLIHPASHSTDQRVANRTLFIPYAFELADSPDNIFPTDLSYATAFSKNTSPTIKEMYDDRENIMLGEIISHSTQNEPVMHFCGAAHMFGINEIARNTQPNAIVKNLRITQNAFITPTYRENLPNDPFHLQRKVSFIPEHHFLLNGIVSDLNHAKELMENIQELGEELTCKFFTKHPELEPKEQLASMEIVGTRTPEFSAVKAR